MQTTELYAALAPLQVGQQVPSAVYIADYADGARPAWVVVARAELGAQGVRLDLEDPESGDLFDRVRVIVLAFPAKVLRTPPQPHGLEPAIVADKLCDLAQQGRTAQKRGATHAAHP